MSTTRKKLRNHEARCKRDAAVHDLHPEKEYTNSPITSLRSPSDNYSNELNNYYEHVGPAVGSHTEDSSSLDSSSNRRRSSNNTACGTPVLRVKAATPNYKKNCSDGDRACGTPVLRNSAATPNYQKNRSDDNIQQEHQPRWMQIYIKDEPTSETSHDHRRSESKPRVPSADQSVRNISVSQTSLKQIQKEFKNQMKVNIPEVISQHEIYMVEQSLLLDDASIDEETKLIIQDKIQELTAQLETFNETVFSLSTSDLSSADENKRVLNILKREIKRLKAHAPIYARRSELIDKILSHRVVIIKADAGTGKSTQVVQYLVDAGLADRGQIICTQSRRLTARTLAHRVADEFGCETGEEVGYHVDISRPQVSSQTRIRFVTDSILLDEYQADSLLRNYAIVVIDEADERRINTDLLFGVMKRCLRQRNDIKLVIMSATLNTRLLLDYYDDSCLIEMVHSTFPIDDEYAVEDTEKYVNAAVQKALEVHTTQSPGDILVFLTDPDDIERAVQKVKYEMKRSSSVLVLPLHEQLNDSELQAVFTSMSTEQRKIIFATNIAETSITIDGIRYVIDTGMVKETVWDSKRNIYVLKIDYATQSSLQQRRSRAGRTSPGKCYHLYTNDTYKSLDNHPRAEILCAQSMTAVLKLKYLNIFDDMSEFDWLETPSIKSLNDATNNLELLGALERHTEKLTELGYHMAKLDIAPMLSKMILAGKQYDCLSSTLTLAGVLSVVDNIWWYSSKEEYSKHVSLARNSDIGGDYILLLNIFLEWNSKGENKWDQNDWCRTHAINGKSLKIARDFAQEMAYKMDPKLELKFPDPSELNDDLINRIIKCICDSFFQHLAVSMGTVHVGYEIVNNFSRTVAQVHRSSILSLAKEAPSFILYHEILNVHETNYLTVLCPIDIQWLPQSWLKTLPQSALQHTLKSYSFDNLGSAIMLSLFGKKRRNVSELEKSLHVTFEVDYAHSKVTIYGQQEQLDNAQQQLEHILGRDREKLRTEIREFEIVRSTRILLGTGAVPKLGLIEDEFVTVLLTHLPTDITIDEIQRRCQPYGEVRTISEIQNQQDGASVSVTYLTCNSARRAVTRLSHEIWDGREIHVSSSSACVSFYTSSQNCHLKALWFMTESQNKGRIIFSQQHAANEAIKLFEQLGYCCQLQLNINNPVVKCSWPLVSHTGEAFVYFRTKQAAQQALQNDYPFPLHIEPNLKQNNSIHVQKIPKDVDEYDLKEIFIDCIDVQLICSMNDDKLKIPNGVIDDICRIFSMYRSFRRESIQVQSKINNGRLEAYVQFTDERELQTVIKNMNGKMGLIGAEKIRLSIYEPSQQNTTEVKNTEFVINLSQLPSNIYEEVLDQILSQHQLTDYVTDLIVFRQQLPSNKSYRVVREVDDESTVNQATLLSFFSSRNVFRSEPDIQICSATEDGRGVASILFDDPLDVMTVMDMYKTANDSDQLKLGQYTLHFIPNIDHTIVLNAALAQAIPNKIQQVIDQIKNDTTLSNITLRKKITRKDEEEISSIIIQGTDIQQITKARIIFVNLMKGLQFKFHNPSWVNAIFNPVGKKFLQNLQNRTGTYIWWNWSSTFLRIFGYDQACNDVYRQIDIYIQEALTRVKYSIHIPIPAGCVRPCTGKSKELKALGNENAKITINTFKGLVTIKGDRTIVTECKQKVKDLLSKLLPVTIHCINNASNKISTIDTDQACPICTGDFESPYSLQLCGHKYCRSCLNDYFSTYLDVTMSVTSFKLCCPTSQCDKMCLIRDIESILGHEKMIRLATIAFQIYIRQPENDIKQCVGINCKQVYRPSKNVSTYFCDQCIKIFCVLCQVEYHTGMTCKEYQQLEQSEKNKKLLNDNLGNLPFKQCPKCSTIIEKIAGCNAMKCTQCSIAFCWRCSLIDEDDVHYHYNDKKSTCYRKCFDDDNVDL